MKKEKNARGLDVDQSKRLIPSCSVAEGEKVGGVSDLRSGKSSLKISKARKGKRYRKWGGRKRNERHRRGYIKEKKLQVSVQ